MTTLDLARTVASAARRASSDDAAAFAVLCALRSASSWFCRSSLDEHGCTVDVPYEDRSVRVAPARTSRQGELFADEATR